MLRLLKDYNIAETSQLAVETGGKQTGWMVRVTGGQGYNAHDAAQSSSPNFILKSIEFDGFWHTVFYERL